MVIYLSKNKLFRFLLIMVIVISILSIFPISLKNIAEDVVSVISGGRLIPIYAVDTPEKTIALSFDATWGSTRTPQILQILDEYEIKTTFFLTNIWLKQYPQLAKEISERGHEIGLHTANHPRLTDLAESKIKKELTDNIQLITEVTGQKPYLFRPPFGAYNNLVIKTATDLNLMTIQWSVDSLDWQNLSAEAMYERITQKIHPGSIVLFHNDGANTPEALKLLLTYFKQEGYNTVIPKSVRFYNLPV
ncbi:MAG TPA: polysaccharide deacetylase family protein [Clostridia bacterium]|nr:polysaccharide deacetylase family protein [Clostridia bacterium]